MDAKPLPPYSYLVQCFDYDPITGVLRWQVRPVSHFKYNINAQRSWNRHFAGKITKAKRGSGNWKENTYLVVTVDYKQYAAHRAIWKLMTGFDPGVDVEHRNTRGDDNRWDNLRLATHSQNMQNRAGARSIHFHLPKGVRHAKGRFQAIVTANGKKRHLGGFATAEEAHEAYCKAARELHGEFFNGGQLDT